MYESIIKDSLSIFEQDEKLAKAVDDLVATNSDVEDLRAETENIASLPTAKLVAGIKVLADPNVKALLRSAAIIGDTEDAISDFTAALNEARTDEDGEEITDFSMEKFLEVVDSVVRLTTNGKRFDPELPLDDQVKDLTTPVTMMQVDLNASISGKDPDENVEEESPANTAMADALADAATDE